MREESENTASMQENNIAGVIQQTLVDTLQHAMKCFAMEHITVGCSVVWRSAMQRHV